MPSAPPKLCSKAGCFSVAVAGSSRCSIHPRPTKPVRERTSADKRYDDARGTAHQRGYDKRLWGRARARQLMEQPLCERCSAVGRTREASEVDHRIPLREGGTHDPDNLQSLCHSCHVAKTHADRRASK